MSAHVLELFFPPFSFEQSIIEHLQEFPKPFPNPWFLERSEKIPLQRLLKSPPNLLALPKTEPSRRKVTRSRARADPATSQVSRAVPGAGPHAPAPRPREAARRS